MSELKLKTGCDTLSCVGEKSNVSITYSDGFNTQWRMPKPTERCLAKGSVVAINVSGVTDRKKLYSAINLTRLGQYANSGMGRICVAPIAGVKSFPVPMPEENYKSGSSGSKKACELFEMGWRESLNAQAERDIMNKALSQTESEDYFRKIREALCECSKSSKSAVRFLLDSVRDADSFEAIENAIGKYAERQKKRGDKTTKPYVEIMEALKPNNTELSKIAVREMADWLRQASTPALTVWVRENMKKDEPVKPCMLFPFYRTLLTRICVKTLAERSGVK